jgi:hypothetical protein
MKPVEMYEYVDESGDLLFVVARFEPKTFKQKRPDGNGGWIHDLDGVRRVPYRLPQVIEATKAGTPVYVVEGERDVHSLEAVGLTATTAPMGAGKWDNTWNAYFAGTPAVVLPDNDEGGRKHAFHVAQSLLRIAEPVKIVELPGLTDKGDVSDWLAGGGTRDELERLVSEVKPFSINDIVTATSWGIDRTTRVTGPPALLKRTDGKRLLYADKLHWLQGESETGKTWFALAAVKEVLDRGEVVQFIDFEDSRDEVEGRLHAMGADTSLLVYVRPDEPLEGDALADIGILMALHPALVVLDGVTECMALHGLDPIRAADVATFMHEILDRFRDANSTIMAVDHVARGTAGEGRFAYGSQHKLAGLDGTAYRFEILQQFSRDQGGAARIDVAKDRPGFVRSFALDKVRAGVLRVVPDGDRIEVLVDPPEPPSEDDDGLTFTQRRVHGVLEDETIALTYREIGDRLASDGKGKPLRRNTIKDAIDALCEKGLADGTRTEGGSPSTFWRTDGNRQ